MAIYLSIYYIYGYYKIKVCDYFNKIIFNINIYNVYTDDLSNDCTKII